MADISKKDIEELIGQPTEVAFLFDFDGTLVDLVPDPDGIYIPTELTRALETVSRKNGNAFAIVTGRALGRLDRFLGITTAAIGSHGAECRPSHNAKIEPLAEPFPLVIRNDMQALAERHDCIFEDKAFSLSLHLPLDQMPRNLTPEITSALGSEARNYSVRRVGRTYEILRRCITKGSGIVHLMKQPGFSGRRPIYVGDDVNTERIIRI